MKDRNGVELQVGDVCVVHVKPNAVGELDKDWHGELCVIDKFFDFGSYPIVAHIDSGFEEWEFLADELEIIGDVRDTL